MQLQRQSRGGPVTVGRARSSMHSASAEHGLTMVNVRVEADMTPFLGAERAHLVSYHSQQVKRTIERLWDDYQHRRQIRGQAIPAGFSGSFNGPVVYNTT